MADPLALKDFHALVDLVITVDVSVEAVDIDVNMDRRMLPPPLAPPRIMSPTLLTWFVFSLAQDFVFARSSFPYGYFNVNSIYAMLCYV
jgi:hypothetical protein